MSDGGCRLCSGHVRAMVGTVRHWEVQLQIARRLITVGSRWRWVDACGAGFLGGSNCRLLGASIRWVMVAGLQVVAPSFWEMR